MKSTTPVLPQQIKFIALLIGLLALFGSLPYAITIVEVERDNQENDLALKQLRALADTVSLVTDLQCQLLPSHGPDRAFAAQLELHVFHQHQAILSYLRLRVERYGKQGSIFPPNPEQYKFNPDVSGAIQLAQASEMLVTKLGTVVLTDPDHEPDSYRYNLQQFRQGQVLLHNWTSEFVNRQVLGLSVNINRLDQSAKITIGIEVLCLISLIGFVVWPLTQHYIKSAQSEADLKNFVLSQAQKQDIAVQEFNQLTKELNSNSETLADNLALAVRLRTDLEQRERELHETQVLVRVGRVKINIPERLAFITAEAAVLLGLGNQVLTMPASDFWDLFDTNSTIDLRQLSAENIKGIGLFSCWLRKPVKDSSHSHLKTDVIPQSNQLTLTIQDLTQERAATLQIFDAKRKAEDATMAKALFLSTMSHEIRTPMNAIIGLADILYQENPRPDQQENLETLSYSAKHLLALLNDLLDFSKIEAGKIVFSSAPFSTAAFLHHLMQIFGPQAAQKKLALKLQVQDGLPGLLEGDELRLNQILTNLISNAIKFSSSGYVLIRVGFRQSIDHLTNIQSPSGQLHIEVEDTGIGIAADVVPLLFEAFHQASANTTREYGGTGLGLSICKRLIELQHGTIKVKSVPGLGSCFSVTLPMVVPDGAADMPLVTYELVTQQSRHLSSDQVSSNQHLKAAASTEPQKQGPSTIISRDSRSPDPPYNENQNSVSLQSSQDKPLSGLHILVVEDNRVNRMVLTKLLSRWGASFDEAIHGQDALDQLEAQAAATTKATAQPVLPHVLLLDLEMPIMDGYQLARILKEDSRFRSIPIVALSANSESFVQETSTNLGLDQYLTKPIDPGRLLQALTPFINRLKQIGH